MALNKIGAANSMSAFAFLLIASAVPMNAMESLNGTFGPGLNDSNPAYNHSDLFPPDNNSNFSAPDNASNLSTQENDSIFFIQGNSSNLTQDSSNLTQDNSNFTQNLTGNNSNLAQDDLTQNNLTNFTQEDLNFTQNDLTQNNSSLTRGNLTSNDTAAVTSANGVPVAYGLTLTTYVDMPVNITLAGFDPDFDHFVFSTYGHPAHGYVSTILGNNLTYFPGSNYSGNDSFTYRAYDGNFSDFAVVSISVYVLNAPPDNQTNDTQPNNETNDSQAPVGGSQLQVPAGVYVDSTYNFILSVPANVSIVQGGTKEVNIMLTNTGLLRMFNMTLLADPAIVSFDNNGFELPLGFPILVKATITAPANDTVVSITATSGYITRSAQILVNVEVPPAPVENPVPNNTSPKNTSGNNQTSPVQAASAAPKLAGPTGFALLGEALLNRPFTSLAVLSLVAAGSALFLRPRLLLKLRGRTRAQAGKSG